MRITDSYAWRTASYSSGNNSCVEVAPLATATGVRDTKDRDRGHLEVGPSAWCELLSTLKR
ncbi:DUF397 domain-containing protein [Embleya sp. AB8]|uniref:DUF397 domain-containing protein n=1 Tax=Embleya sp. AB8 TaxID=3156304 RepID=UPI003C791EBE